MKNFISTRWNYKYVRWYNMDNNGARFLNYGEKRPFHFQILFIHKMETLKVWLTRPLNIE